MEPADGPEVELSKGQAEFARLYGEHHNRIASYIYRRTGDRHVTEDIVADVFVSALAAMPRYRHRGIPIDAWFLRIATNAVNLWARSRRGPQGVQIDELTLQEPERGEEAGDRGDVTAALLSLSPSEQSVLVLHHVEGLRIKQVAQILACREGTVKSRLSRARAAFRVALQRTRESQSACRGPQWKH